MKHQDVLLLLCAGSLSSPSIYHILSNGARLRKIQVVAVTLFTIVKVISHILFVPDPAELQQDIAVGTISSLIGNVILNVTCNSLDRGCNFAEHNTQQHLSSVASQSVWNSAYWLGKYWSVPRSVSAD